MLKEISGAESTTYRPVVAYKYSVNNIEYQGHRIFWTPGAESWSWDVAERMLAPYPVAAYVTVYYDPDKPQLAVLETDVLKYRAFQLFALFPFVVMGIALCQRCAFVSKRRDTGRRCPQQETVNLALPRPSHMVCRPRVVNLRACRAGLISLNRAWIGLGLRLIVVAAATLVAALPIDRLHRITASPIERTPFYSNSHSTTCTTPSSSCVGAMRSAAALTDGCALPIATPSPAA